MTIITIRNDYHNTITTMRVQGNNITARQLTAAKGRLCGMADCCCPPISHASHAWIDRQDGSATLS